MGNLVDTHAKSVLGVLFARELPCVSAKLAILASLKLSSKTFDFSTSNPERPEFIIFIKKCLLKMSEIEETRKAKHEARIIRSRYILALISDDKSRMDMPLRAADIHTARRRGIRATLIRFGCIISSLIRIPPDIQTVFIAIYR